MRSHVKPTYYSQCEKASNLEAEMGTLQGGMNCGPQTHQYTASISLQEHVKEAGGREEGQ